MRLSGISVLRQLETPGWEAPSGEELATIYTDTYKLGLLAVRLLVGDHDTTNPLRLPPTTPNMLRQIIADTLEKQPGRRPLPDTWAYVLGHAIEYAQHQRKTAAANDISSTNEPPPVPIVHIRPTTAASRPRKPSYQSHPSALTPSPAESPPSTRNLGPLYAVFTTAVVAVIVALIAMNALSSERHSATTSPTSESAPSASSAPDPTSAPASSAAAAAGQVTYSVTGTQAPYDQISISYTDGSGTRRIISNVFIPWTITLTPVSQSDVGSIEAMSLLRLSKLNCKITRSDGKVLVDKEPATSDLRISRDLAPSSPKR